MLWKSIQIFIQKDKKLGHIFKTINPTKINGGRTYWERKTKGRVHDLDNEGYYE